MALYIPHSIFHLARLLYVRSETFGPYYVHTHTHTHTHILQYHSCKGIPFVLSDNNEILADRDFNWTILYCLNTKQVNLQLSSKDCLNQHSHCTILIFQGADYQNSKEKVYFNTNIVLRPLMSKLDHNKTSNFPVTFVHYQKQSPTAICIKRTSNCLPAIYIRNYKKARSCPCSCHEGM